ncbi:MAG: hypothetical protein RBR53_04565 [Desulforegulaceae bacterium]|nr:hypothetical protein [Desulforegulaceae bacterium]
MKKLFPAIIMFLLVFPSFSSAMNGMEIYNQYMKNEKKNKNKFGNAILEHESITGGIVISGKIYIKENKSRVESTIMESPESAMVKKGHKTIMIDDGKNVSTFSSEGEFYSFPRGEEDEDDDEDSKPLSVNFISKETVSGLECYKIEANFKYGEKSEMWISVNDFLLVKESMENGSIVEINSDFREVSGILIPFKSQSIEDGQTIETSTLKSVKLNANTDDSLYDPTKIKGYKKSF